MSSSPILAPLEVIRRFLKDPKFDFTNHDPDKILQQAERTSHSGLVDAEKTLGSSLTKRFLSWCEENNIILAGIITEQELQEIKDTLMSILQALTKNGVFCENCPERDQCPHAPFDPDNPDSWFGGKQPSVN